ncbi:MAG: hypothetical protein JNG89_14045 [Planctomycetaceae bacterium]|nr:hypothetical protein [Planctomycetaceae bacterium]
MDVNPGLKRFFNDLVWFTRLMGSRRLVGKQVDQRGMTGAVNLVFGPTEQHVWHCDFGENGFKFKCGPHASPMGTVTVDQDVVLKMLAGMTSYYTAELTGKIRVEGVGQSAWVLSSTVMQSRANARGGGLRGWISRRHLLSILRRSGTGYELHL